MKLFKGGAFSLSADAKGMETGVSKNLKIT
jgi:hypothetical protein